MGFIDTTSQFWTHPEGFVFPLVVIDSVPVHLEGIIVVAQAQCLDIFNLSRALTEETCLVLNKASICACLKKMVWFF